MLEDVKEEFRDRIFSPVVTLAAFISQVLSEDRSCRKAVSRVDAERVAQGKDPCSPGTGGYCQARKRLSKDLIYQLLRETGDKLHGQSSPGWLWRGRRIVMADGSTVSMPDTSENQAAFPQPASQEPGLGFPLARLVVLISYATGAVLDVAMGPNKGKKTGEHALLRQILGTLKSGDILIADTVMESHASRKVDFRKGRRIGKRDHIVEWRKPSCPDWMDKNTYAAIPDKLVIRETRIGGKVLISTFLDPKKATRKELGDLYKIRWSVEIYLKFIKEIMKMDILRCRTPDMVRKEVGVHLLAYNMIRTIMAQAADRIGIIPRSISFKGATQLLDSFADKIAHATGAIRIRLMEELSRTIAYHQIGNRPGRNRA